MVVDFSLRFLFARNVERDQLAARQIWDFGLIFSDFETPGEEFRSPSAQEALQENFQHPKLRA